MGDLHPSGLDELPFPSCLILGQAGLMRWDLEYTTLSRSSHSPALPRTEPELSKYFFLMLGQKRAHKGLVSLNLLPSKRFGLLLLPLLVSKDVDSCSPKQPAEEGCSGAEPLSEEGTYEINNCLVYL